MTTPQDMQPLHRTLTLDELVGDLARTAASATPDTVVIVDKSFHAHELAALRSALEQFKERKAPILLLKSYLPECLQELQGSAVLATSLLAESDWRLLDHTVYPLARDWHKPLSASHIDLTDFHGYPLGDFLEHSYSFDWLPVYWCVFAIDKFLQQHINHSKVVLIVKDLDALAEYYGNRRHWTFKFLKKDPAPSADWLESSAGELLRELISQLGYLSIPEKETSAKLIVDTSGVLKKLSSTHCVRFTPLNRLAKIWLLGRCLFALKTAETSIAFEAAGRAIHDRISEASSNAEFSQRFDLFSGVQHAWFLNNLNQWTSTYPALAMQVHCMETFLRISKAEGVVANTVQFGTKKILTYAARKLSIPTVQRQHGIIQLRESEARIHSDTALIWGQGTRDLYLELGNPPDKLKITGNFQFDTYKQYYDMNKADARKRIASDLQLATNRPVYVLLSQPSLNNFGARLAGDENERACEIFASVAKLRPEAHFIIKLHPMEPPDRYNALIALTEASNLRSVKQINLPLLLRSSELVCAVQSTTLAEAMVLNTPFVQLELFEPWVRYAQDGAGWVAKNHRDLLAAIDAVERGNYHTPDRENARIRWLQSHIHTLDWDASRLFAQALGDVFWRKPAV